MRFVRYSVVPPERYDRLIIDRVDQADSSNRIHERSQYGVDALILHQTGISRGSNLESYDRVAAHFVILPDGRILRLHENWFLVYASNGFNSRSVAVEFVGNFANEHGVWWQSPQGLRSRLSPAQARAGRHLVIYLRRSLRISYVFAHRQANRDKSNCCGPEIWSSVGEWALRNGLSDGGANYSLPDGLPIPDEWRAPEHCVL